MTSAEQVRRIAAGRAYRENRPESAPWIERLWLRGWPAAVAVGVAAVAASFLALVEAYNGAA